MANVLDDLIEQEEKDWRAGIRPGLARQLDPNAGPGEITVAGAPEPLMPFTGWEQDKWAENQNPAQLRQDLNLDILRSKAMQNRMTIEQAQTMNPLQSRLAQARLNATGAHQNFMEDQDAQNLEQTTNFLTDMADPNAPAPNSPGYSNHVLGSLIRNPRFAHSQGGREILKELAKTHDTHLSVEDLKKQGFDVSSVRVGPNGESMTFKQATPGADVAGKLKTRYGLKLGDFQNPSAIEVGDPERIAGEGGRASVKFKGSDTGGFVRITKSDGKGQVMMPVAEFEALGGQYSPETLAKRGGVQGNAAAAVQIDRQALAQKALNDPNASEAHRAAARKILTGQ